MSRKFYYDVNGEKLGPVTGRELLYLRAEGKIDDRTWVRAEDSQTWRPYASVNLREERKKEAAAGPLRSILRNMSPAILLVSGLVLFSLLVLAVVTAVYAWPLILCGLALLMVIRMMKIK